MQTLLEHVCAHMCRIRRHLGATVHHPIREELQVLGDGDHGYEAVFRVCLRTSPESLEYRGIVLRNQAVTGALQMLERGFGCSNRGLLACLHSLLRHILEIEERGTTNTKPLVLSSATLGTNCWNSPHRTSVPYDDRVIRKNRKALRLHFGRPFQEGVIADLETGTNHECILGYNQDFKERA